MERLGNVDVELSAVTLVAGELSLAPGIAELEALDRAGAGVWSAVEVNESEPVPREGGPAEELGDV